MLPDLTPPHGPLKLCSARKFNGLFTLFSLSAPCPALFFYLFITIYTYSVASYRFRSTCAQLSKSSLFSPPLLYKSSVQLGEKVASNIAMVESKRLQVSRNSVSWQPHSSTTSVNKHNFKQQDTIRG